MLMDTEVTSEDSVILRNGRVRNTIIRSFIFSRIIKNKNIPLINRLRFNGVVKARL